MLLRFRIAAARSVDQSANLVVSRTPLLSTISGVNCLAISVDRLGDDWATLTQLRDFPFVEIKVDRELVSGCADDRAKRRLCQHIVEVANRSGARTVAVGVETEADFLTARELGFDLIQGFLFAKPMGVRSLVHLFGIESPGLTASLAIAGLVAELLA